MQRKLGQTGLQPKLTVNRPGDVFEQEADRVADAVIRMDAAHVGESGSPPVVQRKCAKCEEEKMAQRKCAKCDEEEKAQRKESATDAPQAGAKSAPVQGPGSALPQPVRTRLERNFGHDFTGVRIHSDARAAESARSLNADAYTLGSDIVFAAGKYSPGTVTGQRLLAHELTHFIQQQQGAPLQVQRQAADGGSEGFAPAAPSKIPEPPAPPFSGGQFEVRPDDPPCSGAPKGLGKKLPEVDCPDATEDIGLTGFHFHFCLDSDVFLFTNTPTSVMKFARKQPAQSTFKVHGYASVDGQADDNRRLSCHRALRVARELINAGVPAEHIEIAKKGATEEFPGGAEANRVVVVKAEAPGAGTPSGPNMAVTTQAEKEAVVERARTRIREGTYELGADAYISFWTCGRIKRVSDAVDRMHVLFQGDPALKNKPGAEGTAEKIGTNVIALSDAVLEADNQDDCVAERLVDMSFHQMTLDTIDSFALRHQGSRFLLGLAGLDICSASGIPDDPIPATDPLANQAAPVCADAPLPARFDQQPHGTPATFTPVTKWTPSAPSGGPIQWQTDFSRNRALIVVPRFPISGTATVQAKGKPDEIAQYEVGYMQTITEDLTTVNYASGHTLELRVPTPVRDRERRASTAPWFSSTFVSTPDASIGTATSLMFKQVITEVPIAYEAPESGNRIQPGNIIDTATRHIHFVTWLVARRKGAPLDRFATHFLDGREFDFTEDVDVLDLAGEGTFKTDVVDATPETAAVMQFSGQTPEELGPNDVNIATNPPPREVAGKVLPSEYRRMLRDIVEGLNPSRLGLGHSPLEVIVTLNKETGRVVLPGGKTDPVVVSSPNVPQKPRNDLAREVLIRARKRDFLQRPDTPAIVKRYPATVPKTRPSRPRLLSLPNQTFCSSIGLVSKRPCGKCGGGRKSTKQRTTRVVTP